MFAPHTVDQLPNKIFGSERQFSKNKKNKDKILKVGGKKKKKGKNDCVILDVVGFLIQVPF